MIGAIFLINKKINIWVPFAGQITNTNCNKYKYMLEVTDISLTLKTKDQNWGCCSEVGSPWTAWLCEAEFGPGSSRGVLGNSSLRLFSVSSDQGLYSRRNEQGRRARIHNSRRCQQTVQAEEQSLSAHGGERELARANQDPAGVRGETRRRRLPLHRTHALWGGQVRLCPSLQRLPKDVQRGKRQRAKPMRNWPRLKPPVWLKIAFSVWPGIFPGRGENSERNR